MTSIFLETRISTLTKLNYEGNRTYGFILHFDRIVFFLLCIGYYEYKLKEYLINYSL